MGSDLNFAQFNNALSLPMSSAYGTRRHAVLEALPPLGFSDTSLSYSQIDFLLSLSLCPQGPTWHNSSSISTSEPLLSLTVLQSLPPSAPLIHPADYTQGLAALSAQNASSSDLCMTPLSSKSHWEHRWSEKPGLWYLPTPCQCAPHSLVTLCRIICLTF